MHTLHRAALLAACLLSISLGACNTMPSTSGVQLGTAGGAIVTALPPVIQAAAIKACGYEVPLATIANILATFAGSAVSGATSFVTSVAGGICKSVKAPANNGLGLLDAPRAPVYRGVTLDGYFVK